MDFLDYNASAFKYIVNNIMNKITERHRGISVQSKIFIDSISTSGTTDNCIPRTNTTKKINVVSKSKEKKVRKVSPKK